MFIFQVNSKLKVFMDKRVKEKYVNDTVGVNPGTGPFEIAMDYVQISVNWTLFILYMDSS